jgi:hypothetical protein
MKECKHCCGDCCWFKHESTDGWGMCYENNDYEPVYCGAMSCDKYISVVEMRHHLAILMLHNRLRRSNEPTGFYKMQDPKEIGLAIDFAIKYIKTFMEL